MIVFWNHVTPSLGPKNLKLTTLSAQFVVILLVDIPTTILLSNQWNIILYTGKRKRNGSGDTVYC